MTILKIDNYNQNYEGLSVEKLVKKLESYNKKNNDEVLFVDLIEKIILNSSSEDIQKMNDNSQLLLKNINKEINKLSGEIYFEEEGSSIIPDKLLMELGFLKKELLIENNPLRKNELITEIFLIETQILERGIDIKV